MLQMWILLYLHRFRILLHILFFIILSLRIWSMVHVVMLNQMQSAWWMVIAANDIERSFAKIPSMVMMVIQSMLGQTMGGPSRKMALFMTTGMLYLIMHISVQNTTATSMWRFVQQLKQ